MTLPVLLLINLHSKQGLARFGEGVACFNDLGVQYIVGQVRESADFARAIRHYRDKVSAVVIGGGDGTFNVAMDALVESGLPLGILPLGTANDLARTLNLPASLPDACAVIAQGGRRRIDLGRVNGKYFDLYSLEMPHWWHVFFLLRPCAAAGSASGSGSGGGRGGRSGLSPRIPSG